MDASLPDDAAAPSTDAASPSEGGSSWTTRALSPGPSYMGSGGGGCNTSLRIHRPRAGRRRRPASTRCSCTSSAPHSPTPTRARSTTSPAAPPSPKRWRAAASSRSRWTTTTASRSTSNKTSCLYGADHAQSMLAVACALPEVDCTLGIATWGHSQGALMAHAAATFDAPRARGVDHGLQRQRLLRCRPIACAS